MVKYSIRLRSCWACQACEKGFKRSANASQHQLMSAVLQCWWVHSMCQQRLLLHIGANLATYTLGLSLHPIQDALSLPITRTILWLLCAAVLDHRDSFIYKAAFHMQSNTILWPKKTSAILRLQTWKTRIKRTEAWYLSRGRKVGGGARLTIHFEVHKRTCGSAHWKVGSNRFRIHAVRGS